MNPCAQIRESERREAIATRAALERLIRISGTAIAGSARSHLEQPPTPAGEALRRAGLPGVRVGNTRGLPAVDGPNESLVLGDFGPGYVCAALLLSRIWKVHGGAESAVTRTGSAR